MNVSLSGAVRAHRVGLVASAALAVVGAACALAPYLAVYAVTVALFVDDAPERLPTILLWTAAALVVRAVAGGLATHIGHVTAYRTLEDLRLAIGEKLGRMPLGRVQARSSGEMKKVLHDDVEQIEEALAHGIPDGAAAAAVPLATTVVLFAVDWRLALLALGSLVLLVAVSAVGMMLAQRNNREIAEHSLVLSRTVMGYLQGIRVIRGYLRADSGYDRARDAVQRDAELQDAATSGPLRWLVAVMGVATSLSVALLLPGAGAGYLSGRIDLGAVVLVLMISLGYLTPIVGLVGTLATIMTRIQLSAAAVEGILGEPELPEPAQPRSPNRFDVEFDGVSFGYRDDRLVLEDVSLLVPEGGSLAIVGATGGGKSTLARLLARFYDCDAGAVRIGGIDVRDIASRELTRLVAFIQQDEYVFEATLLENIRIARPGASDDEVRAAGSHAQLDDVVTGLADGWDTRLGSGGGELSGGQKQRIAVARALLKDAPIIVLDEATASLDAATERRTLEAIERLSRGRTVLTIAHRLSTITGSDTVALVDEGRIAATGTHERLLDDCPEYAALWGAYLRSDGWRLDRGDAVRAEPSDDRDGAGGESTGAAVITADAQTFAGAQVSAADDAVCAGPCAGLLDEPAADIERPGLAQLGAFRQWRTMYGRSWPTLVRQGLLRLAVESLFRGAPLLAVLLVVLAALDELPGGATLGIGAEAGAGAASGALDSATLWAITALLAAAMLARVAASAWSNSLIWRLASRSKAELQLSILDRLRKVPLGFLQRVDTGRIGSLVTSDVPMVDFQNLPQQVVGALIQPIIATALLAAIDWRLALAALAGLPVFWALTVWSDRIYRRVFAEMHAARQEATTVMLEQARGAAVLRGNPDSAIALRYRAAMTRLADASTAMSVKATPATALGTVAVESGQLLLIAIGAALFSAGAVSAATLLIFLMLSLTIYQPVQELAALAGYRRNQQQIAAKVGEVWDAPVLSEPEHPRQPRVSSVELRGVTFGYQPGQATLREVSLRAEAGNVTALVGASGSGKSTIASLISRLWDVDAGSVEIGGVDVRQLGSRGVVGAVTTVFQDTYLFDDTVRFNLRLARPEASDDELWSALRAAQCDEVIEALPNGLDTVLADGGTDLSGGQRQRLAIARALLKDSPVLVLDEAVAAVDPGTEDRIQRALAALAAGRTVIVIAHRLATVEHADRIVVIDGGTVAGSGTHEQLRADCPEYRALLEAQTAPRLTDTKA